MKRSLDAAAFNRICNDPAVRPWMGQGLEPLDLAPVVAEPANCCLLTERHDGAYLVQKLAAGLYVAHTLALPSARGRPMLRLMRQGFEFMFTATDAIEITTFCPDGNPQADRWAQIAGFRETFRREAFFPLMGQTVGGSFRALGYLDWALAHGPNRAAGKAFHDRLHAASPQLALHPDDAAHDAMVGATLKGCQAGNVRKAVELFNRWAAQAGYLGAAVLSEIPPVVDTGDAILGLDGGELQILHVKAGAGAPTAV